MTSDDKVKHIRLDSDNVKTAERRSKESDRGNMTAYINRLIREDGERNPKARQGARAGSFPALVRS